MSDENDLEEGDWENEGGAGVREPRRPVRPPNTEGAEQEVDVAAGFIGSGSCWYF